MFLEQLQIYAAKLQEMGYMAEVLPANESKPVAELMCLAHIDDKDRDYVFQIMYVNELIQSQGIAQSGKTTLLQFNMRLPLPIVETQYADTARLLHVLNTMIPAGSLILSETENQIWLRALLMNDSEQISSQVVAELIKMSIFVLKRFSPMIEQVASGENSYTQIIDAIMAEGTRISASIAS